MTKTKIANITIDNKLLDFVNNEVIPGTDIDKTEFWNKFSEAANDLSVVNAELIKKRKIIQSKIDDWHRKNKDFGKRDYQKFLKEIGYIVEEGEDFKILTDNVDEEIAKIAGPQLVVPVDNARYALNAVNARWGSLYDSLYGTDAIPGEKGSAYNKERGYSVIDYVKDLFDKVIPISNAKWSQISEFGIEGNKLVLKDKNQKYFLRNNDQFIGFQGEKNNLKSVLFKNNNLHIDIIIDPSSPIGKMDVANISDVIIESAISTIVDNEDSVAAVDAGDKVKCYRNWLGIMKGDLETEVEKNDKKFIRKLNPDRNYKSTDGNNITLHGRSLILNRNVGHLMKSSSILLKDGSEIPEGILDGFMSVLCAKHDLKNKKNSRTGSVYIVKPKMHGPEEVSFTNKLFNKVENVLKLEKNTVKIGIMDEERRTTVNLKECIREVKERIVFINTGFLDRTGDEMHTSMESGPMIFKGDMKKSKWLSAYENWNVDIGLSCGFSGKAQIGKGMWAMPDRMADMLAQKINHPMSGANCAWVPSPTAATLHATHYHKINVFKKQKELSSREKAKIEDILSIPTADRPNWSKEDILKEVENNAQSILGYVVRWINQGVGCSKVPDINNVGLMEDRATLRISSQHIANWVHHGVCSKEDVLKIFKKMAVIVDKQNVNDKNYEQMSKNYDNSIAFKTACELALKGKDQPSGYTEPLLHQRRLDKKASL